MNGLRAGISISGNPELFSDEPAQAVPDIRMAWDGGFLAVPRVNVDVVV
jgi:hypothetical protein